MTLATAGASYKVQVKAFNEAGSVLSGTGAFVLADVPVSPAAPVNDATVTDATRIKVTFAAPLPNNRGSTIFALQLAIDDGNGGNFTTVLG
jgi:hypothetical protein